MADNKNTQEFREKLSQLIIKIISTLNVGRTTLADIIAKNINETFQLRDILFLIYLLEKCNVIRREKKTYPFYNEFHQQLFKDINYFYYQPNENWSHIKYEPERLKQLLNVILTYYQENSIIQAS